MLIANFDFTDERPLQKILAISLPPLIASTLTYPLLRIQALLGLSTNFITNSQFNEIRYYALRMLSQERFPRLLSGFKYSLDYSVTYTAARFLILEYLLSKKQELSPKYIYGSILSSTALSTLIGQPAFVYRLLTSGTQINAYQANRTRSKLLAVPKLKIISFGLKQTLLYNCLTASTQLLAFVNLRKMLPGQFIWDVAAAAVTALTTSSILFPLYKYTNTKIYNEYSNTTHRINFNGFMPHILRRTLSMTLLFTMYTQFFNWRDKKLVQSRYRKRQLHQSVQRKRQGISRQQRIVQIQKQKQTNNK